MKSKISITSIDLHRAKEVSQLIRLSPSLYNTINWCHKDFTEDECHLVFKDFLSKEDAYYFYVLLEDKIIGMVSVNSLENNVADLGFWIADDFQRKGYGTQAVNLLVDFCFSDLEVTYTESRHNEDNTVCAKFIDSFYQ